MQTQSQSLRLKKAHLLVSIGASLVVALGFVVQLLIGTSNSMIIMTSSLIACIVIFYLLGHVIRFFLLSQVFLEPIEETVEADAQATQEEDNVDGMVFAAPTPGSGVDPDAFRTTE